MAEADSYAAEPSPPRGATEDESKYRQRAANWRSLIARVRAGQRVRTWNMPNDEYTRWVAWCRENGVDPVARRAV